MWLQGAWRCLQHSWGGSPFGHSALNNHLALACAACCRGTPYSARAHPPRLRCGNPTLTRACGAVSIAASPCEPRHVIIRCGRCDRIKCAACCVLRCSRAPLFTQDAHRMRHQGTHAAASSCTRCRACTIPFLSRGSAFREFAFWHWESGWST